MNQLIKSISKYIKVPDSLKKDLESQLKFKRFGKREIVLDEHEICTQSYFIEKGILRLYYLKDGKEITEFFCAENQWINSPKSFINQEIDVYYIETIEEAQVWSLHVHDLVRLFNQYPAMEKYARMDMGSTFLQVLERLAISRFSTAREKYQHFLKVHEDVHHRIPLGMAASYIGVTQETLSRLRKNTLFDLDQSK
jgi:CRP-like cAMP-binding protein